MPIDIGPPDSGIFESAGLTKFPNARYYGVLDSDDTHVYFQSRAYGSKKVNIRTLESEKISIPRYKKDIFNEDYSNPYWVFHSNNTLYFNDGQTIQEIEFEGDFTWIQYYKEEQQLWGMSGTDLFLINDWSPENGSPRLSDATIMENTSTRLIHKDRSGIVWAGTTGYGFCLLYTSPSPRDQRGSRMPSSA